MPDFSNLIFEIDPLKHQIAQFNPNLNSTGFEDPYIH